MKIALFIVCAASVMVSACANASDGNPGGVAYAGMPGGVIATRAQTIGVVTYDPGALHNTPDESSILGKSGDREIPARPTDAGTPAVRPVDQF